MTGPLAVLGEGDEGLGDEVDVALINVPLPPLHTYRDKVDVALVNVHPPHIPGFRDRGPGSTQ